MTTWLTSDEHYGHKNILAYSNRPFKTADEMNEELVHRHNFVVLPSDTVVHLGDFSLDERLTKKFLPRLHGEHILVVGNHDACHPHRSKHLAAKKRYLDLGFKLVCHKFALTHGSYFDPPTRDEWTIDVDPTESISETSTFVASSHLSADLIEHFGNERLLLTHLPSANDYGPKQERDLRYVVHRPDPTKYDVIIHGHVHEAWKARHVSKCIEVNVGVDQWGFAPVSLGTLAEYLRVVREADRL